MILVDLSQIVVITCISKFRDGQFQERQARDAVVSFLLLLEREFRASHGEMVLCADRDPSWRRAMYAPYKFSRRQKRQHNPEWAALDTFRRTIEDELAAHCPWRTVGVKWAEGDDVIATLVATFASERTPVLILSADRDFVQLHRFPGVTQRDPKTRALVLEKDEDILIEKLLYGDSRDGVPNILSDDRVFVEGRRQTRLHRHLREKWGPITSGRDVYRAAPEHYAAFRRNEMLIDLMRTPQYIRNKIIAAFRRPPAENDIVGYIERHRLRGAMEQVGARRGSKAQGHLQETSVRDRRRGLPSARAA